MLIEINRGEVRARLSSWIYGVLQQVAIGANKSSLCSHLYKRRG